MITFVCEINKYYFKLEKCDRNHSLKFDDEGSDGAGNFFLSPFIIQIFSISIWIHKNFSVFINF